MNKNKNIILMIGLLMFSISSSISGLTISNYNTKSIRVEVMDCPSKILYSFPTNWKPDSYNDNPIRHIYFLHVNHVLPNGQVVIDNAINTDMPSNVCLHIEGWSSFLGGVITQVRSTCEMSIYDNGFLQGINVEYHRGC